MSSDITTFQQMKSIMEESKGWILGNIHKRQGILKEWLTWVDKYSSTLCDSYQLCCDYYGFPDHLNYQCKYNFDTELANYNRDEFKCLAGEDTLQFVLFSGCKELLFHLRDIQVESKPLDMIYK